MNKIKILLVFTVGLSIIYFIHFLSSFIGHNIYQYYSTNTMEEKVIFAAMLLMEVAIFIALNLISIGLIKIIKSGVFTSQSAHNIKNGGILFLFACSLDFTYTLYSIIESNSPELWLQRIVTNVLLLLLGITALIISDVLVKGSFIKKENDLTI